MTAKILLAGVGVLVMLLVIAGCAGMKAEATKMPQMSAGGGQGMMDIYVPKDKVMKMRQMMMKMQPDTLEDATVRGEKMFNNTKLGQNTTGQSCASCHSGGGSVGGAAEMKWKGMSMKVAIPTLKGAAAHFPAVRGPMKKVADLGDMNNMCIMTFMKGRPLNKHMQPAVDLQAYVASLSVHKRYNPGGSKIGPTPVPGAM